MVDTNATKYYHRNVKIDRATEKERVLEMKKFLRMMAALMVVALCMSTFATVAMAASKVTATGNCNVRTGPGLYYSSRGTLHKGETATYLDSRKRDDRGVYWLKIRWKGKTGWVSTKYARVGGSASVIYYDDDDEYVYYDTTRKVQATASVNVRLSPRTSGTKVGTISKGTKLSYRGKMSTDSYGNAWFAVYYKGYKAWVSARYSYLR